MRCAGTISGCWGRGTCRGNRLPKRPAIAIARGDSVAIQTFQQGDQNASVHGQRLAEVTGSGASLASQVRDDATLRHRERIASQKDVRAKFDGLAVSDEIVQRLTAGVVRSEFFAAWWIERVETQEVAESLTRFVQVGRQGWTMARAANPGVLQAEALLQQRRDEFVETLGVAVLMIKAGA